MEILTDNYIWIIVIVVVILMTIIGYIAEKTNFGKKEFSKKKEDKKVEEKKEEKKEVVKPEIKIPDEHEPKIPEVETPEVEMTTEAFQMPEEPVKVEAEKPEEDVHFTDPLADDMNVSSDVLETPYKEGEEILSVEEDLNAPFGETAPVNNMDANSFDAQEDLNAPFGDFEIPNESPVEENLNTPLEEVTTSEAPSYNIPDNIEEDLNVPFGDNAEIKTREEFNLNLPDIDSIKEDVDTTANNDSDDDIWKF